MKTLAEINRAWVAMLAAAIATGATSIVFLFGMFATKAELQEHKQYPAHLGAITTITEIQTTQKLIHENVKNTAKQVAALSKEVAALKAINDR